MAKHGIIDSHIHLWPEETASEDSHAWMTHGMPLAKSHLLADYYKAARPGADQASDTKFEGVVYIETDVRYDLPLGDVATWAKGPLNEIRFLRSVVEGKYDQRDSEFLLSLVPWAPMDQIPAVLEEYLRLAGEAAGAETWQRVKGFRFLLQAIRDERDFRDLVLSDPFRTNLQLLGKRGFSFDVGVDHLSGGIWQLEALALLMSNAQRSLSEEEKIDFVVNHLCKPDFSSEGPEFDKWCTALSEISVLPRTYMKLSGAFSKLPPQLNEDNAITEHMKPWMVYILGCFGPSKIMFGSDWPVCNVSGRQIENPLLLWQHVVMDMLADPIYALTFEDEDRILRGTAREAYRL